jgi:hypothetical protein
MAEKSKEAVFENKYRFYNEDDRWYIDLPEWTGPKADLEMVEGADILLSILANDNTEVHVKFSDEPFEGSSILTLLSDGYYVNNAWHGPSMIWLCHVTEFVFGRYPKYIYYQKF